MIEGVSGIGKLINNDSASKLIRMSVGAAVNSCILETKCWDFSAHDDPILPSMFHINISINTSTMIQECTGQIIVLMYPESMVKI